jgi:hypothetical protein
MRNNKWTNGGQTEKNDLQRKINSKFYLRLFHYLRLQTNVLSSNLSQNNTKRKFNYELRITNYE